MKQSIDAVPQGNPPGSFPKLELLLLAGGLLLVGLHHYWWPDDVALIKPETLHEYRLGMRFSSTGSQVSVGTFLPESNSRQTVINQQATANHMEQVLFDSDNGLLSRWRGAPAAQRIDYRALIHTQAIQFSIADNLELPSTDDRRWQAFLQETPNIQVHHSEIVELWQTIKPDDSNNLLAVLQRIYQYTYDLPTLPFKGTTDALTAMRLGAASCNGKSRLFVALARLNHLPARLVGGIVLNEGQKKTSHQWVEVNVAGHWVPFDPTNGYFAELPDHYLELYRGDQSLFSHTPNIQFDYQFSITQQRMAPALFQHQETLLSEQSQPVNLVSLLSQLNLTPKTAAIFLMLPLCALLITGLRNMFGCKSFGIFMPMLIGAACAFVGLISGLLAFTVIVLVAYLAAILMQPLRLLKIPRLAAIITIITVATLALMLVAREIQQIELGLLALFPVIIISFIADKLHNLGLHNAWKTILSTILGTLLSITMCYLCLTTATLQGIFAIYPEVYLLVLAGQIYLGRWTGIRVSECLRFAQLLKTNEPVMGINERNRNYVGQFNQPPHLRLAANKLRSKALLVEADVPVPETIERFDTLSDAAALPQVIANRYAFVIKPNAGSQGNGIIVIQGRDGPVYLRGETRYSAEQLQRHVRDIISGVYSQLGDSDVAYIEPLINQHPVLAQVAPDGLCDIRLIVQHGQVISAMLRIPTRASGGKANLHQGALGAGICLETGRVFRCISQGKIIENHPDSDAAIVGLQIPFWQDMLSIGRRCFEAIPLGYMGVDVCLDAERGPLVLEVNGRPGLEIQNINQRSLVMPAASQALLPGQ